MSNHELEMPEPRLDISMANREILLGQPQFDSSPPRRFEPGERVRVGSGVFAGAEGVVLECRQSSRLLLAVDMQQQGITLEIDGSALDPTEGILPRSALIGATNDWLP